jgi:hypothetical protein
MGGVLRPAKEVCKVAKMLFESAYEHYQLEEFFLLGRNAV